MVGDKENGSALLFRRMIPIESKLVEWKTLFFLHCSGAISRLVRQSGSYDQYFGVLSSSKAFDGETGKCASAYRIERILSEALLWCAH